MALSTIGADFNNQASAMKFAICFTSDVEGEKRKVNYEEAKKLFDFICENVQFEEDRNVNYLGDMVELAKSLLLQRSEEKSKGED